MIVIQDVFSTELMGAGHDATISAITHDQFLSELGAISEGMGLPLIEMMSGHMPKIGIQITNRSVAQFVAQLVGVPNVNCTQQYSKLAAPTTQPVFVYVIQPNTLNNAPQNFQRDTLIYKVRMVKSAVKVV